MEIDNKKLFAHHIPDDLLQKGISLQFMGYFDVVWEKEDCIKVIEILIKKRILVLGGDVFVFQNNEFKPTDGSWFIESSSVIPTDDDLIRSKTKAIDYMNKFSNKNGRAFYFSIVYRK
jgi:hypothetical protein